MILVNLDLVLFIGVHPLKLGPLLLDQIHPILNLILKTKIQEQLQI